MIRKRHRRGVTSGEIRNAGRITFVITKSLRLAVGKINDAMTARTPAVVGNFFIRRTKFPDVIAVVGDLMIKFSARRVQFQHPFESPTRFVENIGNTVRARLAK